MKDSPRAIRDFYPPLGLMAVIFILSSIPGRSGHGVLRIITSLDPQFQNLLHIPLFTLLQYLWLRTLVKRGRDGAGAIAASLTISLGYGLLDEFHQYFVPGRYASLTDVLLNLVGAVLGVVGFLWINGRAAKFSKHRTAL